jgi:hypothetical protein
LREFGVVSDSRFVVDERSLDFTDVDTAVITESLELFADEIAELRADGELISILSGWGSIACMDNADLSWLLATSDLIPRDLGAQLLSLLDKCIAWDEANDVAVDPLIEIDGERFESYGIAWSAERQSDGLASAVVTLSHRPHRGAQRVKANSISVELHFVAEPKDHPAFYRSICVTETLDEDAFYRIATKAFPRLRFAEGLTFRRFAGRFEDVFPSVVTHLGVLNDSFLEAYRLERGHSGRISMRIGIDVSIEGTQTRSSESLMKQRDAVFEGTTYRCEWHSKIEPHRNRIHFSPPSAGNVIVVGLFVDHLDT